MSLDETKLFEIIPVDSFIVKTASFDLESPVKPEGTLVIETTGVEVANLGCPDYFVNISLFGMTYVECDPDKAIMRKMFADVMTAVQAWTPELVTQAFGFEYPARCVGIININSTISSDKSMHVFRLDVRLVLSDVDLSSENFLPSAHLNPPYLVDEQLSEDGYTKTAYICYSAAEERPITRVITTKDGTGRKKTIEIMFAFGAWEDRYDLEYTRN